MGLKSVLITDPLDPICEQILGSAGVEVTTKTKLTKEELLKEIKNYEGLIVRSSTQVTEDVINAGEKLKIVGRAGTGVDNIDTDAATRSGVMVMNTPGGNTLSAAEHTCALIVALSKHIAQACASLKSGKWDRKTFLGEELNGKVLGIIGLGRVGREVASRMQAFGMQTIGYDPMISGEVSAQFGVEFKELNEIWKLADYITLHVPLIPQTANLIGSDVIAKCKKGVKIVNVARGGILDEEALFHGLQSGQVGGAALDVFNVEPPTKSDAAYIKELIEHPRLIATPHLGASTAEAQFRVAKDIAEQFIDVAKGRPLVGLVNAPSLAVAMTPAMKPWVGLGEAIGKIAAALVQSDGNPPIEINCVLRGSKDPGQLLFLASSSVLLGFMKQASHRKLQSMNLVNVPILAADEGIIFTEQALISSDATPDGLTEHILEVVLKTVQNGRQVVNVTGSVKASIPILLAINSGNFGNGVDLEGHMGVFLASDDGFGQALGIFKEHGKHITAVHRSTGSPQNLLLVKAATPVGKSYTQQSDLKLLASVDF
ncbi:unnamed protein product [Notodromas monacha]|uniref:D-3-phosphoglycerate dehydrogenase n=1 Tax=Notodromas monacha TaxID=399045 RepID=A0A7R9BS88_9CRUS|nr:unnamed protein product [Notodromas monacha]CAG0919370.1 unnamed protein product [Notodromas monacha]